VAVVAVLCVAAGLAMWWSSDGRAPETMPVASVAGVQADRTTAVDPGLAAVLRSSVTLVDASGCGESRQGTTTLLDTGNGPVALTNQHVVAGTDEATFAGADGESVPLPVTRRVSDRDAVHLDADALADAGVQALPVGPRPIAGSAVMVAGFPAGGFEAKAGHVVRVERRHGYGGTVDMLIIDVQAIPGISGGVVVDAAGRAVGLVAARDPESGDTVAYPLDTLTGRTQAPVLGCSTEP
jgi:S1-C subfamily serine protease